MSRCRPCPGNRIELRLILAEPASDPLAFTIENPARIALDLQDTGLGLESRRKDVGIGVLDTVLAAEAGGRTRVVLNLDQMVPYSTLCRWQRDRRDARCTQGDADDAAPTFESRTPAMAAAPGERAIENC